MAVLICVKLVKRAENLSTLISLCASVSEPRGDREEDRLELSTLVYIMHGPTVLPYRVCEWRTY